MEESLSGTSKETTSSLAPTFDLARRRFPPGTNQDILKPRFSEASLKRGGGGERRDPREDH